MPNLAGYDFNIEIHKKTIIDFINLKPFTNPVDGKTFYLLGGPFSTNLLVDLGIFGEVLFRVILDVNIDPIVHQPLTKVTVSISGGSNVEISQSWFSQSNQMIALSNSSKNNILNQSIGGLDNLPNLKPDVMFNPLSINTLSHIGGEVTFNISMGFTTDTSSPYGCQTLVFLFRGVSPKISLDNNTKKLANVVLGRRGADLLSSGLVKALKKLFSSNDIAVPVVGFTVVPGIDSHTPQQFSALPDVVWIDDNSLGMFGYYKSTPTGGDYTLKQSPDFRALTKDYPGEYFTKRAAILLSSGAFQQVIACPMIRNSIVRGLIISRDRDWWIRKVRAERGSDIYDDIVNRNFNRYLMEEFAKHEPQNEDITNKDIERAKTRVNVDVEAAIVDEALKEENDYLNQNPNVIDNCVPPPCGNGSVQVALINSDIGTQTDTRPMLTLFRMDLGKGKIIVTYKVVADFEVLSGDSHVEIRGEVDVLIDRTNVITQVLEPVPTIGGTGLTGLLISFFKNFNFWNGLMHLIGLYLQRMLSDLIKENNKMTNLGPLLIPQNNLGVEVLDTTIDSNSLMILYAIKEHTQKNEFAPEVNIDSNMEKTPSVQLPIIDNIKFPATEWGCPAVEFKTTRTFWDTKLTLRMKTRDISLPINNIIWTMEISDFHSWMINGFPFVDHRPYWNNSVKGIVVGQDTLLGSVIHPESPLLSINGFYSMGKISKKEVLVAVSGDSDSGWEIEFQGADGNFIVRFSIEIQDGDGKLWHGEANCWVLGDALEVPPEYYEYSSNCNAKHQDWLLRKGFYSGKQVLVSLNGVTDKHDEWYHEIIEIRTLVQDDNPTALSRLTNAMEKYGTKILKEL
jgi:hypothetical protein